MCLNFYGTKLSRFSQLEHHLRIVQYFEQVLQNRKQWIPNSAPCSVIAFILDRKYKYGQRFVRLVSYEVFLVLSGQPCRFVPSIHENKIRKY